MKDLYLVTFRGDFKDLYGESYSILGIYDSREKAMQAIKIAAPRLYEDEFVGKAKFTIEMFTPNETLDIHYDYESYPSALVTDVNATYME